MKIVWSLNSSFVRFFSFVSLVFLLSGCDTIMTREGVREVEQKREISDKVTSLQRTTADVNSRFSDLEAEQRQLNGRVEVVENRMGQAALDREKQKKSLEEQNSEMQKKIQVMQDEIVKLSDTTAALTAEIANLKVSGGSDAVAAASAPGKEAPTAYDVAEDLFGKKDFKKAILNYQKFRDSKPKDKRVPEATYKIGVCFQELGLKDEAKSFYQELIAKFPGSTEAKKAKIRLKKLK